MRTIEEIMNNTQVQITNNFKNENGEWNGFGGYLNLRDSKHTMSFMLSIADHGDGYLVEHVSVSYMDSNRKTPTWEEMCAVKDVFWGDEEEVHQVHPRKSRYVHGFREVRNILHLWRPFGGWGAFEER